jgi:MFS family permease
MIAPLEVLRSRDYRIWISSRFIATIGIQMQSVAVGWQVYSITRDPLHLGYVGLAQFLPLLLLSLPAGHAADRYDRKRLLAGCYGLWGIGCAALALLDLFELHDVRAIYAVLVLLGAARAFAGPAGQSFLPHLVPAAQYPSALALSSSTWQVAVIAGPSIGGTLYGVFERAVPVYTISLALEIAAALLMLSISVSSGRLERAGASFATLVAGIRYVFRKKMILGAISLDLVAVLLGGAVALLPAIASDELDTGPWGLGLLRSATALGALGTALYLTVRPLRSRLGIKMFVAVAIYGVAIVAFGLSKHIALSIAALAVSGAADMVSVFIRHNLIQLGTPNEMRGRVSAVSLVFISASNELGEFESGVAAKIFGVVRSVVIGGVGTVLVTFAWAGLFPSLRRVDRVEDVRPPEPDAERPDPRA